MIIELLRWWYGPGWMQTVHRIGTWTSAVERTFSGGLLLRTLFAPWRRITSGGGRSMDAKVRDALDNFVSRCIGAIIRSTMLLIAGLASLIAFLVGVITIVIWPLLPAAVIYGLVRGIIG